MSPSAIPEKRRRLVIVGEGEFAEIAFEYFSFDSEYEVAGFAVEAAYFKKDSLCGLPVVRLEEVPDRFPSEDHEAFVAITYTQLNRVRRRLYQEVKRMDYRLASYVSSKAFVWHNVEIGENCFIFEANVLQHHSRIGDNVILWSGNHVGHRATIGDHCFVSSHVVVSGYAELGDGCFVGVNSAIGDYVKVARDCIIGAGAMILKNTEEAKVYRGNPATAAGASSYMVFNVKKEER
jgi:sugar O-acyltransferase (sialic acid O-acetyltransferase NeuD family)